MFRGEILLFTIPPIRPFEAKYELIMQALAGPKSTRQNRLAILRKALYKVSILPSVIYRHNRVFC